MRSCTGLPDNPDDYDTVCGNGPYPRFCPHGINIDAADCGPCLSDEALAEAFVAVLEAVYTGKRVLTAAQAAAEVRRICGPALDRMREDEQLGAALAARFEEQS